MLPLPKLERIRRPPRLLPLAPRRERRRVKCQAEPEPGREFRLHPGKLGVVGAQKASLVKSNRVRLWLKGSLCQQRLVYVILAHVCVPETRNAALGQCHVDFCLKVDWRVVVLGEVNRLAECLFVMWLPVKFSGNPDIELGATY